MLTSLAIPIITLCAITTWIAYANFTGTQQAKRQRQTLRRGLSCPGTVVAVQRPFLLDPYVRVYFDFLPQGREQPLRCCHMERHESADVTIGLPATGSQVVVCYLPGQPEKAVIGALVDGYSAASNRAA